MYFKIQEAVSHVCSTLQQYKMYKTWSRRGKGLTHDAKSILKVKLINQLCFKQWGSRFLPNLSNWLSLLIQSSNKMVHLLSFNSVCMHQMTGVIQRLKTMKKLGEYDSQPLPLLFIATTKWFLVVVEKALQRVPLNALPPCAILIHVLLLPSFSGSCNCYKISGAPS